MLFTVTLVAAAFGSFVLAHPGEAHVEPSPAELTRRHHSAVTRSSIASNCGAQVAARHRSRMAKRSLGPAHQKRDVATDSVAAQSAMYPTIQNTTCVLAPEVTEGPYYTRNELVRTDLREDQEGIDLSKLITWRGRTQYFKLRHLDSSRHRHYRHQYLRAAE